MYWLTGPLYISQFSNSNQVYEAKTIQPPTAQFVGERAGLTAAPETNETLADILVISLLQDVNNVTIFGVNEWILPILVSF